MRELNATEVAVSRMSFGATCEENKFCSLLDIWTHALRNYTPRETEAPEFEVRRGLNHDDMYTNSRRGGYSRTRAVAKDLYAWIYRDEVPEVLYAASREGIVRMVDEYLGGKSVRDIVAGN